jgi:hypothetical protein
MTYTELLESLNQQAQDKISCHPALDRPSVIALIDWRLGPEQLEWFISASVSTILGTARQLSTTPQ